MIIVNMIAATLIGILAGLGVGGGGLLVIYLTLVTGMEQLNAQGINLCFFLFCSTAAMFIHFKKRRINIKQTLSLSIVGIAGSVIGSYISHNTNPYLLKKLFGALLIISGITVLFTKKKR
ncbi:MAG: sulfite exporter TauE/SafE family protein [Clostridia bacterium]|nr:sulfite exporter TauE/SafE family protein [Clostridia bacterium]